MLKEGIGDDIYHTHFRNLSDGRWWSPDPLEYKFPSFSPYVSMGGNPILNTDNKGDSVYAHGNKKDRVLKEIQEKYPNLEITMNISENNIGHFEVKIKNNLDKSELTFEERIMYDALIDDDINVNIYANSKFELVLKPREDRGATIYYRDYILAGMFGGITKNKDSKNKETYQFLNYNLIDALEKKKFISSSAEVTSHEILESYFAAKFFNGDYNLSHDLALTVLNQNDLKFSTNIESIRIVVFIKEKKKFLFIPYTSFTKIYETNKNNIKYWDTMYLESELIFKGK